MLAPHRTTVWLGFAKVLIQTTSYHKTEKETTSRGQRKAGQVWKRPQSNCAQKNLQFNPEASSDLSFVSFTLICEAITYFVSFRCSVRKNAYSVERWNQGWTVAGAWWSDWQRYYWQTNQPASCDWWKHCWLVRSVLGNDAMAWMSIITLKKEEEDTSNAYTSEKLWEFRGGLSWWPLSKSNSILRVKYCYTQSRTGQFRDSRVSRQPTICSYRPTYFHVCKNTTFS